MGPGVPPLLRVAVAGAGFMGTTHAQRWAALPEVRVVGVYSRTAARAEALARPSGAVATDDIQSLLAMPADVVDICLPTDRHADVAVAAFAARRHVVCEKPIALDPADGERMAAEARRADRLLLVAHVVRFWPEYARLREMVLGGAIGRPTSAAAERLQEGPGWVGDGWGARAAGGGPVVDLQIHDHDFLASLFGVPRLVQAVGGDRHVFTTYVFDGGAVATAEAASDMPRGYPFTSTLRVRGDEGVLEYVFRAGGVRPDEAGGLSALTLHPDAGAPAPIAVPPGDAYTLQLAHFADCLRRGEPSGVVSPASAIRALRIALAARAALDAGTAVRP